MEDIKKLDAYLLEKFQWIATWFETWIGITCFTLTKTCMGFYVLVMFIACTSYLELSGLISAYTVFLACRVYGIQQGAIIRYEIKNLKQENGMNRAARELANDRLITLAIFVLIVVFFSLRFFEKIPNANNETIYFVRRIKLADTLFCLGLFSAVIGIYFCSCTPRPPKKSKVRQLLENTYDAFIPRDQLSPGL